MTLWERVEALAARVGELEAKPRMTLDGDGELRRRIEALEWRCIRGEYPSGLLDRIAALETRLPKPAPVVADPVERSPSDDAPIGALEAIREPVTFAGDRWPAGGGGIAGRKMWGHESVPGAVWVGDEPPTKEQVDAERQRRAIERGVIPPPPPYEELMLKEACGLLHDVVKGWDSEPAGKIRGGLINRIDVFLARARVATEEP